MDSYIETTCVHLIGEMRTQGFFSAPQPNPYLCPPGKENIPMKDGLRSKEKIQIQWRIVSPQQHPTGGLCRSLFVPDDETETGAKVASGDSKTHLTEAPPLKPAPWAPYTTKEMSEHHSWGSSGILKVVSMKWGQRFSTNLGQAAHSYNREESEHFSHCAAETIFRLLISPIWDKIHHKASPSLPKGGSGPMQTGQINKLMPTLCQSASQLSLWNKKQSKSQRSLLLWAWLYNYKLSQDYLCPQHCWIHLCCVCWGINCCCIGCTAEQKLGMQQSPNCHHYSVRGDKFTAKYTGNIFDLAQSAISQHRPQLGRESRQTRPGIQRMWARTGIRVALGKTAMPRADHSGFIRQHPRTNRCILLSPHSSTTSDTAWMQHPTYSLISSPILSGDCIGANFQDSAFKRDAPGKPFHPNSSLDGPHISHGKCGGIWGEKIPRSLMLLQSTGLAFQIEVSGFILDILSDFEERRSLVSSRKISHLQKSPTASPSSSMVGTSSKHTTSH